MKNLHYLKTLVFAVSFLALFYINGSVSAQEPDPENPEVNIPFIDRDSDGINDLLQNGWGLRFLKRYKKRQELWDLLNVEIIRDEEGLLVDTDGDGVGDVSFREFMKGKMGELIDTDGDGVPDTPIKNYFGRRFRAFDHDGDGLPDDLSREEMRKHIRQMKEWRKQIHDRVRQGLPAFTDEDEDGIPDNLPEGFHWRGHKRNAGE